MDTVKKLTCSALLCSCFIANAGTMGEANTPMPLYEVSAGALFLRPAGATDYNVLTSPFNPNVPTPILSPRWEAQEISPSTQTGFTLNLRRNFADTNRDISLNWAHLRTNDTASTAANNNAPPYREMDGPFFEIGPDAGVLRNAVGRVKFNYDVVNLEAAKHIQLDSAIKARLFGGISGVWLKEELTATYTGDAHFMFSNTNTSKFNGGGLRVGLDGAYQVTSYFDIVGLVASSVLLGSQQPNTTFTGTSDILIASGIPVNHQGISHKSYTQVVPALDAKLGLKFNYAYSPDCVFSLEGGYMGAVYVNAIQNYVPATYVPGSEGINTGSIFLQSLTKTTEDFSVNGPYVTASLKL